MPFLYQIAIEFNDLHNGGLRSEIFYREHTQKLSFRYTVKCGTERKAFEYVPDKLFQNGDHRRVDH